MSKIGKVKAALMSLLMEFSRRTTDRGLISWHSDDEIPAEGTPIFVVDENDAESTAEDGMYKTEDGYEITVENGIAVKVEKPEVIIGEPEEMESEVEEVIGGETIETVIETIEEAETIIEDIVEDLTPEQIEEVVEVAENIIETVTEEEMEDEVNPLEERIARLEALVEELLGRLEKVEKEPAGKPASEEFKSINKIKMGNSSNEQMNNLSRILSA